MKGLVIGMGRTGLSITRHWRRLGYTVDATDSRPRPPAAESFSGHCDGIWCDEDFTRWPRQRFDGYDAVAVSPGVAPSQLPLPRSRLTNDVALFDSHWRRHGAADTRLLAVTGTNGKSTVTALAAHLARRGGVQAEAIGNLGEPMLDALLRWRDAPPPSLIVAELSSFQLEIAGRFHSDAAVVLNLSEDHLDRHGTLQRYGAIKRRLYRHTRQAVINLDDPTVASWRRRLAERTTVISLSTTDSDADWHLAAGSIQTPNFSFPLRDLSPAAAAQPSSVLAALALLSVTPRRPDKSRQRPVRLSRAAASATNHRRKRRRPLCQRLESDQCRRRRLLRGKHGHAGRPHRRRRRQRAGLRPPTAARPAPARRRAAGTRRRRTGVHTHRRRRSLPPRHRAAIGGRRRPRPCPCGRHRPPLAGLLQP